MIGIEDETFKNYYIKQDSIRAIINEKPEEQSRGIEQVLGTAEIREFIDALNKKFEFPISVAGEIGKMDEVIEMLLQNKEHEHM